MTDQEIIDAIIEELRDEEDCLECSHSRAAHRPSWQCMGGDDESGDHCPCRGFVAPTCEHCGRELEGRTHLPQGGYCVLAPVDGESTAIVKQRAPMEGE